MRAGIIMAAVLTAAARAAGAGAETIHMVGTFPALARELAASERLSVGRFAGDAGESLARAIEWRLAQGDAGGPPHYRIVPPGIAADAVLDGDAYVRVDYDDYSDGRSRCVEKKDGKCVRKERYSVACRRRAITVDARIRGYLIDRHRIAYDVRKPRSDSDSWCEDDVSPAPVGRVVDRMIESIAGEVRTDVAPHTDQYDIRVREGRDGMPRDIAQRFKAAVKLTKHDAAGGCAAFRDLARVIPDHPSIAFNLALCTESEGDYDAAAEDYRRARLLTTKGGGDIDLGIERTRGLLVARHDAEVRAARPHDLGTLTANSGMPPPR